MSDNNALANPILMQLVLHPERFDHYLTLSKLRKTYENAHDVFLL